MKANELRIGNWVENADGYYSSIEASDFPFLHNYVMSPIPLSPEILEKAGFGYRKQFNHFSKPFKQGRVNIAKSLFDANKWCLYDWQSNISCEFEHLHQLQNLYFALTGDELEIEL